MNRADLEWALKAVLPHVGTRQQGLDRVGLEFRGGVLCVYATDRYSAGVAMIPGGPDWHFALDAKEAAELMRWVRPQRVAEREMDVVYAVEDGELHVGWGDDEYFESGVFETVDQYPAYDVVLDMIHRLHAAEREFEACIYQPKLMERFAKAQRADTDRLTILPRRAVIGNGLSGAAVVTVGDDFIGAVAGLTYENKGAAKVAAFLDQERKHAA